MAVPSINTALMDDVLRFVFSKLETKEEKDAFGLVCKRWLQIQNTERRRLRIRSGPKMLRRMAVRFSDIIELDMSKTASRSFPVKFSPAYFSVIAGFPLLRDLDLSKCKGISDAGLITLGNVLPRLQSLDVSRCKKVTDKGLIAIAKRCRNLRRLHLAGCRSITDDLLQALSQSSSHLEDLGLTSCYKITDSGIICLVDGCRQIKFLDVSKCYAIGDVGISRVAEVCSSSLKVLKLLHCYNVTGKSISLLSNSCCYLEILVIRGCFYTSDKSVRSLAISCSQRLRILNMSLCVKITDPTLSCIFSNCRYLRALDIGGCHNITDAAFQGLKSADFASALKVFMAPDLPRITVAAIRMMLEFCKWLDFLRLWLCPLVTQQSCEEAGIQFPDSCEVDFGWSFE